jgi:hypothetical protein
MPNKVKHQSHLTAIHRKDIPVPVKWILQNNKCLGKILDFGCGKCYLINPSKWDSYDPYYKPDGIKKEKYDTIFCTYVLCTLPKAERQSVLHQISLLLDPLFGIAYITVRNDKPKQGWGLSKRNTYQGRATELDKKLHLIRSTSQYRIYEMRMWQ